MGPYYINTFLRRSFQISTKDISLHYQFSREKQQNTTIVASKSIETYQFSNIIQSIKTY